MIYDCHKIQAAIVFVMAIIATKKYLTYKMFCCYYCKVRCCHSSISTALAMAYAGARGKTAEEIYQALKFGPLKSNVHETFSATLASLNATEDTYTLCLANGVFADIGFSMRPSYKTFLDNYYSAGYKELEFSNKPEISAKYINKWVMDRTNDKITKLVKPSDIRSSVLALVNAIYFKGTWKYPFNPRRTKKATFHILPSVTTLVNMMTQTDRFRYSFNHRLDCQILELPYRGNRLVMDILLPKKIDGLAALESNLTYTRIALALARLRTSRRSVAIPRFEMNFGKNLPKQLGEMGMRLAFNPSADFRGISPGRPLFIHKVIHKAFIGVDEKGTEAAAATVVLFTKSSVPPIRKDFVADHPFLFLIRDFKTGSILFLGRLVDPRKPK